MIATDSRSARSGRGSWIPSRSSHAPLTRPRYARPRRDGVEHRDLAGDLVRVERERIEGGRPESHSLRDARHQEERPDRGLVEEVVIDETTSIPARPPAGRSPRTPPAAGRSEGRSRARALRQLLGHERPFAQPLDPHHDALVGIGTADEIVLLEPVLVGQTPHLRGEERYHATGARRGRNGAPRGCARGSTRSPRTSRLLRDRRPSDPRSVRP